MREPLFIRLRRHAGKFGAFLAALAMFGCDRNGNPI